eukprot:6908182-Pyramimonas_sp.AAC.1
MAYMHSCSCAWRSMTSAPAAFQKVPRHQVVRHAHARLALRCAEVIARQPITRHELLDIPYGAAPLPVQEAQAQRSGAGRPEANRATAPRAGSRRSRGTARAV